MKIRGGVPHHNRPNDSECSPSPQFVELFSTLAEVLRCGTVLGRVYSIGPYKSACEEISWAVLSKDGTVRLVCADLYSAGLEFVRLESMVPAGI